MLTKERFTYGAALWLGFASVASAHPPHVDTWMHVTNIGMSTCAAVAAASLARKKAGLGSGILSGVVVFSICAVAGFVVSFVASL
jgi:hypothetical protein